MLFRQKLFFLLDAFELSDTGIRSVSLDLGMIFTKEQVTALLKNRFKLPLAFSKHAGFFIALLPFL